MTFPKLTPSQIEQIARILGETGDGFSGSEIGHHLAQCQMKDPDPGLTKWKRLNSAFGLAVKESGSTNAIYQFVQHCLEPVQGLNNPERYNWMRLEINKVLMFVGVEIRDNGQFYSVSQAQSLSEVQRRTKELRAKLTGYGAHSEVLRCCREELLAEDYFHAVQEASKSLCDRVRTMSGLLSDGAELFRTAFSVKDPYIAYNSLRTSSEQNQQNGLKEMLCGVIHMVRNVTAHELRTRWDINEKDAVDILTQISYLHKLLDVCTPIQRTPQ
jgi:uncharacterized protein (TIGR02391 family)